MSFKHSDQCINRFEVNGEHVGCGCDCHNADTDKAYLEAMV